MITILLTVSAYTDIKKRIIPDAVSILLILVAIIINKGNIKNNIIPAIIIFSIMYFIAYLTNGGLGGGDIKLLASLTLCIGEKAYIVILTAAIIGLVIGLAKRQKDIPMAPYILIGYLIMRIFNFLIFFKFF